MLVEGTSAKGAEQETASDAALNSVNTLALSSFVLASYNCSYKANTEDGCSQRKPQLLCYHTLLMEAIPRDQDQAHIRH